ncbi:MAG: hypothetical protein QXD86_04990 [Candidatus Bathyarchaeia archaeon]
MEVYNVSLTVLNCTLVRVTGGNFVVGSRRGFYSALIFKSGATVKFPNSAEVFIRMQNEECAQAGSSR